MRILRQKRETLPRPLALISLTVCLSFVLSTGPLLQKHALSLVNSHEVFIYGSAYKESLIHFPTLSDWLSLGLEWRFLMMAGLIIATMRGSSVRHIFVATIVSTFVVLTIGDFAFGLFRAELTAQYLFENIIANLFGALLVAKLMTGLLIGCDLCLRYGPGSAGQRNAMAGGFSIATGVLVATAIYYLSALFYNPLPVKIVAYLDHPFSGALRPAREGDYQESPFTEEEKPRPFSLFPSGKTDATAHWQNPAGELMTNWSLGDKKSSEESVFNAAIRLFSGCGSIAEVEALKAPDEAYYISNVRELAVWFDEGPTEFESGVKGRFGGRFDLERNEVLSYWTDQDDETKKIRFTQFIAEQTELRYSDASYPITFYLNATHVSGLDRESISLKARTLHIRADGHVRSITFKQPVLSALSTLDCVAVDSSSAFSNGDILTPGSNLSSGVLIRVEEEVDGTTFPTIGHGLLRVSGDGGWIAVRALDASSLRNRDLGWASFLNFQGNVVALEIEGSPIPVSPFDTFTAIGRIQGTLAESGQVRFAGLASAFFRDQARLNSTKWERLTWEIRLLLLSALGSSFGLLTKVVFSHVVKRSHVSCLTRVSSSNA